jgi:uncharacterized membrane protein
LYSAVVGLLLIGALFIIFFFAMRGEGLSRNRAVGIRTKATLASDAAWQRGHNAAAPWVLSAGVLSVVMGFGALALTLASGEEGPASAVQGIYVTAAFLTVIVVILVAARVANNAAQRESPDPS